MLRSTLLLLLLLTALGRCDTWRPPEKQSVDSPNGRYRLYLTPVRFEGILPYFRDKAAGLDHPGSDGRPCRGRLCERLAGGEREIWSGGLGNEVSPVGAVVADDGRYFVTLDNWHAVGYGEDVVAAYGPIVDGNAATRRWSLEQILSPEQLAKVQCSVSSRYWRSDFWLDAPTASFFVVCEPRQNPWLRLDLVQGQWRPGAVSDLSAQVPGASAAQVNRVLDVAVERDLTGLEETARQIMDDSRRSPGNRLRAGVLLARSGDKRAAALFREACAGGPAQERTYALANCTEVLGTEALPLLRAAMRGPAGPHWGECQESFASLGEQAVPTLLAMLADRGTPDYRGGAAHALGKIRSPRALPRLLQAAEEQDEYVASAAFHAAVATGGPELPGRMTAMLRRKTRAAGSIGYYFSSHRYAPAVRPLLERLCQARGKQLQSLREALRYQMGADLGLDLKAWRQLVGGIEKLGPLPEGESAWRRGELLERLGSPVGLHWMARGLRLRDTVERRKVLTRVLLSRPRLKHRAGQVGFGDLCLSDDCRRLISCREQSSVWDCETGAVVSSSFEGRVDGDRDHPFSSNGQRLVVPTAMAGFEVREFTGKQVGAKVVPTDTLANTRLSPDGELLLTFGDSLALWRVTDGTCLERFEGKDDYFHVSNAYFSPDGKFILGMSNALWIAPVANPSEFRAIRANLDTLYFTAVDRFLGIDNRGSVLEWNLAGKKLRTWSSRVGRIRQSAYSKVARRLALAYDDGTILIVDSGKRRVAWRTEEATALALSPDGSKLAVASHEGQAVEIYSLPDGRRRHRLELRPRRTDAPLSDWVWVKHLGFPRNNLIGFANDHEAGITCWQLPPHADGPDPSLSAAELERLVQAWTGLRLDGIELRELGEI